MNGRDAGRRSNLDIKFDVKRKGGLGEQIALEVREEAIQLSAYTATGEVLPASAQQGTDESAQKSLTIYIPCIALALMQEGERRWKAMTVNHSTFMLSLHISGTGDGA